MCSELKLNVTLPMLEYGGVFISDWLRCASTPLVMLPGLLLRCLSALGIRSDRAWMALIVCCVRVARRWVCVECQTGRGVDVGGKTTWHVPQPCHYFFSPSQATH